ADRLVERIDHDDRRGRAEDLLLRDAHARLDVAEDRRAVVEAAVEAVARGNLAPGQERRALVPADAGVGVDLVEGALVDDRPDVRLVFPAGPEAHLLGGGDEPRLELADDRPGPDH